VVSVEIEAHEILEALTTAIEAQEVAASGLYPDQGRFHVLGVVAGAPGAFPALFEHLGVILEAPDTSTLDAWADPEKDLVGTIVGVTLFWRHPDREDRQSHADLGARLAELRSAVGGEGYGLEHPRRRFRGEKRARSADGKWIAARQEWQFEHVIRTATYAVQ
jgi:hypothetical protein